MSKEEVPTPKELWNSLLNISPIRLNDGYPDMDMLREAYQRFFGREESKLAKLLFQKAIGAWNSEQVRDFVDVLTDNQMPSLVSSEESRDAMIRVYKKIFE